MTFRDKLKSIGFNELPHFAVAQPLIYDLGRKRSLSFGSIGTPNEMLWICQENDKGKDIEDLVCLRNYDYDGLTTLEDIKDIIKAITGKAI